MTGNTVSVIEYVRVQAVSRSQSTGMALITGSSVALAIQNFRAEGSQLSMDLVYSASYGAGLLGASNARTCNSTAAAVSIDGQVYELLTEGTTQQSNMVTGRTFGQATSGIAQQAIRFVFPDESIPALKTAGVVRVQYCDNVVEIIPESLVAIQGFI